MSGTFPIRMNYAPAAHRNSGTPVDVYDFTIIHTNNLFRDTAVALCWFIQDRKWMIVDIEDLVPIQDKTLNG